MNTKTAIRPSGGHEAVSIGTLTLSLLLAASAHAENRSRNCYPLSADRDRDGYAASGTASTSISVGGLACPNGYVNREEDCNDNDNDNSIYPRRWEDAYNNANGIDDDCDGAVDEPEPVYPSNVYQYTYITGFWVPVRINLTVLAHYAYGTVYTRVRYKDMSYDDGYHTGPKVKMTSLGDDGLFRGWVDGYSGGVFRAYIRFYDANDKLIASSDPYEVALDPSVDVVSNVEWARYWIVNQAMHDLLRSEHGELGYHGSVKVDGTNYGASRNEKWCSEFYARSASSKLRYISNLNTVGGLQSYFTGYRGGLPQLPNGWYGGADKNRFRWLQPGDYLALDPDKDGEASHSGMVIAYDAYNDRLQTIEGNSGPFGNSVAAATRELDQVVKGYGSILSSMLY